MWLVKQIKQILSDRVKQSELSGRVVDTPFEKKWPKSYHHNSWDGDLDTLDKFLQRRIDAGYPSGQRKIY